MEGFVFAHVADEGLIESTAGSLLRYRRTIGAENVRVFADIKKKHSAHAITADVDIVETAKAAEFFQADGVIVSGISTGQPADASEVAAVSSAVSIPTLLVRVSRPRTSGVIRLQPPLSLVHQSNRMACGKINLMKDGFWR